MLVDSAHAGVQLEGFVHLPQSLQEQHHIEHPYDVRDGRDVLVGKQSALQEVDRVCKCVRYPGDHEQAGECNFEVQAVQNEGPMQGH